MGYQNHTSGRLKTVSMLMRSWFGKYAVVGTRVDLGIVSHSSTFLLVARLASPCPRRLSPLSSSTAIQAPCRLASSPADVMRFARLPWPMQQKRAS